MSKNKSVSIRPSEFSAKLDVSAKSSQERISGISIDRFTSLYIPPPNDDGYFDFRSPPLAWSISSELFSEPHLFMHAFCLASHDEKLRIYYEVRGDALKLCQSVDTKKAISDLLSGWIFNRPKFTINRLPINKGVRVQWNAWSKEIRNKFGGLSRRDYGLPATTLWMVFSSKSMLTSEDYDNQQLRDLRKNLVEKWDEWLSEEVGSFSEILASLRTSTLVQRTK